MKFLAIIKKIFKFVKKGWKWLLPIITTISGIIAGLLLQKNSNYIPNYINNNNGTITVPDSDNSSTITIKTPIKDPDSAGLPTDIKNNNEVTINHETTDRKDPFTKSINNSAYTHLHRK
jgi:uncharacterized membrane protein